MEKPTNNLNASLIESVDAVLSIVSTEWRSTSDRYDRQKLRFRIDDLLDKRLVLMAVRDVT